MGDWTVLELAISRLGTAWESELILTASETRSSVVAFSTTLLKVALPVTTISLDNVKTDPSLATF